VTDHKVYLTQASLRLPHAACQLFHVRSNSTRFFIMKVQLEF